jgi:hypothetical protein
MKGGRIAPSPDGVCLGLKPQDASEFAENTAFMCEFLQVAQQVTFIYRHQGQIASLNSGKSEQNRNRLAEVTNSGHSRQSLDHLAELRG